jgi:DNA-binding XRE family transcriptional regulator
MDAVLPGDEPLVFDSAFFDERCRQLGATTEPERAALVRVDKSTLWRFRNGEIRPRLEVAHRFKRVLGCEISDLWKPEA